MKHPIAIIGAGPIGLAAAAHAAERGLDVVVLEVGRGRRRRRGRVVPRPALLRLVRARSTPRPVGCSSATGTWAVPDGARYPTGGEWRTAYLQPLADALGASARGSVRYGASGDGRRSRRPRPPRRLRPGERPVRASTCAPPTDPSGSCASAVIDASGTWRRPNPLGADGYPALGETEAAARITYGIPDFSDAAVAARYAGKHVAVAGKGASAQGVLIGLARLAMSDAGTRVSWLLRRPSVGDAFGGGDNDQLEQRGRLGQDARSGGRERARDERDPVPHRVRPQPRTTVVSP